MCKMIFDYKLKCDNYCNNYIYKKIEKKQVLEFDNYNIMVRLSIIYKDTIKYSKLLLSNEHNGLLIANSIRNLKHMFKQTFICKTVLNNFTC